MARNEEVLNKLPEGTVVFSSPEFDNSIIGLTFDGRAIYSYESMIEEYIEDNSCCTEEESIEFIAYNTIRALPYAGPNGPLILCDLDTEIEL